MPKLHRCPDCGREHSGFTEKCRDCFYGSQVTVAEASVEDARATRGYEPTLRNCVTKRGRPRQYRNNAEKQAAWRQRGRQ